MPIHDYECPNCTFTAFDHYTPRLDSPGPVCERCPDHPLLTRLWSTNTTHHPFASFEFELDSGQTITVDSMAKLRRIEADSMKAYKTGEGRPTLFRHYSQDKSNRDKNLFEHLRPAQPDPRKMKTKAGRAFEFGGFDVAPAFHPATERAMERPRRKKSDPNY